MDIKNVSVIGGGSMGRQIGLNAALHGYNTVVYDIAPDVLIGVKKWASDYLSDRLSKGKMNSEEVERVMTLFRTERDVENAVRNADLIIEAVVELEDVKHKLFQQLNKIAPVNAIMATNSSYMVSSLFAKDIDNPARLCNVHYYNPALVMKFVELVQGSHCSAETAETVMNFLKTCGKKPIWQKKEIAGFAGNYLLKGLQLRARYLVENGYCSVEDVDIAMEEGFHHAMGPFRMEDFVGINVIFDIMSNDYAENGEKPPMYDVYKKMVEEGHTGKQAGQGFYHYD